MISQHQSNWRNVIKQKAELYDSGMDEEDALILADTVYLVHREYEFNMQAFELNSDCYMKLAIKYGLDLKREIANWMIKVNLYEIVENEFHTMPCRMHTQNVLSYRISVGELNCGKE